MLLNVHALTLATSQFQNLTARFQKEHYALVLLVELFNMFTFQESSGFDSHASKVQEISVTTALICFIAYVLNTFTEFNEMKKNQTRVTLLGEAISNCSDNGSRDQVFMTVTQDSNNDSLVIEEITSNGLLQKNQRDNVFDISHYKFYIDSKQLKSSNKNTQEPQRIVENADQVQITDMISLVSQSDQENNLITGTFLSKKIQGPSIFKSNSVHKFTFVPLKHVQQSKSYLLILKQAQIKAEKFLNINQVSVGDISAQSESSQRDFLLTSPVVLELEKIDWQQMVNFRQRTLAAIDSVEFTDYLQNEPRSENVMLRDQLRMNQQHGKPQQATDTQDVQFLQSSLGIRKSLTCVENMQNKNQNDVNTSDKSFKSRTFFPASVESDDSDQSKKSDQLSSPSKIIIPNAQLKSKTVEMLVEDFFQSPTNKKNEPRSEKQFETQEISNQNQFNQSFGQPAPGQARKSNNRSDKGSKKFESNKIQDKIAENEMLNENIQLKDHIKRLQTQIETSKIFTFMVIHDLKHPTESLQEQLGHILTKLFGLEEQILDLIQQNTRIKQSSNEVSEQTLVLQRSVNKILQTLAQIEGPHSQNPRQIIIEESKDGEQSNQLIQLSQIIQERLFDSGSFMSPMNQQNQIQELHHNIDVNLQSVSQFMRGQQSLDQQNDSENIDLNDFEEGDKQDVEERVVSPKSNQQRLNFDIRSPQWISFMCHAQKVLEIMYQSTLNGNKESLFTVRVLDNMTTDTQQEFYFSATKLLLQKQQQPKTTKEAVQRFQNLSAQKGSYQIDLSTKSQSLRRFATQDQSVQADQDSTQIKQGLSSLHNRASTVCRDVESISQKQSQLRVKFENQMTNLENSLKTVNRQIDTVKMLNYTSGMMKNLMMDLLDLAQMEKNTFRLNKDYFSIFEVINMAFGMVSHISEKKNVLLKPPQPEPKEALLYMQIYGDKNRFLQVIINFLSNSLKFSNQGSEIHLHLTLLENHTLVSSDFNCKEGFIKSFNPKEMSEEPQPKENPAINLNSRKTGYMEFMLSIQDFGVGIPQDKLNSIFINFGNLEEHRKSNPSGRGLGLSICKSIVEQMGGKVIVESELGKGSIFSMTFKVMYQLDESSRSNSQEKSCQSLTDNFPQVEQEQIIDTVQNKEASQDYQELSFSMPLNEANNEAKNENLPKLLLVNDDPFLLWTYEQVFQDCFEIQTAENGLQALQIVNSVQIDHFDLILLDLNMPIMDGFDACERINSYIYQEESFFVVPKPKPYKTSKFKSLSSSADHINNNSNLGNQKSIAHVKFSTKNKNSGKVNSSMLQIETSFEDSLLQHPCFKRPLIYALTGDVSKQIIEKVQEYPFCGIFESIGVDETQMLLQIIEERQNQFEPKRRVKKSQSKRQLNDVPIDSSFEQAPVQKDLRIILENSDLNESEVIDKKGINNSSSCSEGKELCSEQSELSDNISNKAILISGSSYVFEEQKQLSPNTMIKRVNVKEMARIVNFSRRFGSSQKKLNEFQPSQMSTHKKLGMQQSHPEYIGIESDPKSQIKYNHQSISHSQPLVQERNSIQKPSTPSVSIELQLIEEN